MTLRTECYFHFADERGCSLGEVRGPAVATQQETETGLDLTSVSFQSLFSFALSLQDKKIRLGGKTGRKPLQCFGVKRELKQ